MTINFGIDLGTTNSLIAKYTEGKVEVFKNPIGWRNTLPSVVAFRKDRIIVGEKAREYIEKDPNNVFGFFKRKMGTPETYWVPNLEEEKNPIEFSSLVLRELKNFIIDSPLPESVVITIPTSFDTIQSNATKKAGYLAGFQEVVLLQEPVAASLAFANSGAENNLLEGQWIVYDLGGGTFDVALVQLENGEMRVIDHQGDNYLGGLDFDNLIIEQIIAPYLESQGSFSHLITDLKGKNGRLNRLYYELLYKAEDAKIQLSVSEFTEIEIDIEDEKGKFHEVIIPISRQSFEKLISQKIDSTLYMITKLLDVNKVNPSSLNQVVLVGGSTYIPYVRNSIQKTLGIPVNFSVDPTTAVVIGAAYFAGTRTKQINNPLIENSQSNANKAIEVNMAFAKTSQETLEYFTAELFNFQKNTHYRITRSDGGYDSGLKKAQERINEMLPLLRNVFNIFNLQFFDAKNIPLASNAASIGITQGIYNLHGQPLPSDISIEVDDPDLNTTRLEVVFEKNSILPLKKILYKTLSKTINKGSDESILINVLEGSAGASPSSCLSLGIISISGKEIPYNLIKGSDVEITLEISESRDLKINVWFAMTSQELVHTFSPSERYINVDRLRKEVRDLLFKARKNIEKNEKNEDFEKAGQILMLQHELEVLSDLLLKLIDDDSSDLKYQLEEKKRHLAQSLDFIFISDLAQEIREAYFEAKRRCEINISLQEGQNHAKKFNEIIQNERNYLDDNKLQIIKIKTQDLNDLSWDIEQKKPKVIISYFHHLSMINNDKYTNPNKAKEYKLIGHGAIERQNYEELISVLYVLFNLLTETQNNQIEDALTGLK